MSPERLARIRRNHGLDRGDKCDICYLLAEVERLTLARESGQPSADVSVSPSDPVPGAAPAAGDTLPAATAPSGAQPSSRVGTTALGGLWPPEDPPEVAIRRAREEP